MKHIRIIFALSLVTLLLPGCMQVDYVGQHFTPSEKVDFLGGGDSADGYDMMGRATLTAPEGYNAEEIRQKLREEAQAAGADAIVIDSVKRQETGSYESSDTPNGAFGTSGNWNNNSWNTDGSRNYTNSWGETGSKNTKETKQYDLVVKSYFLRRKVKDANPAPTVQTPVSATPAAVAPAATPVTATPIATETK